MLALLKNLHTYQKMGLKSIARISEWEVKIDQGILSMRNQWFSGDIEKCKHWELHDGINWMW